MEFLTLLNTSFRTNCYVLLGKTTCAVIDPVIKHDDVLKASGKAKVEMVLITHGHFDHFCELESYLKKGVPVYLSREANIKLANPSLSVSKMFVNGLKFELVGASLGKSKGNSGAPQLPHQQKAEVQAFFVKQGDIIKLDDEQIIVHKFKGHTDCGLAFELDKNLFAGDFVFAHGYIGRTDLPTGSEEDMQESLKRFENGFAGFSVFPGHGRSFKKE